MSINCSIETIIHELAVEFSQTVEVDKIEYFSSKHSLLLLFNPYFCQHPPAILKIVPEIVELGTYNSQKRYFID